MVGHFYLHSKYFNKNLSSKNKFINQITEINLIKGYLLEINRKIESGISLFYYYNKERFILSSDIVSISRLVPLTENKEVVQELLTQGYTLPPTTIYNEVFRVSLLDKILLNLNRHAIYPIHKRKVLIPKNKEADPKFFNFLKKTLKLDSEKKFSVLFSGGLDSSIICKLLKKDRYHAYSTGFEFFKKDLIERNYAFSSAKDLKINIKYLTFDFQRALIFLPDIIEHMGEPINHVQTVLLYSLLHRKRKNMNNIVLNGQAADGIFGTNAQYNLLHKGKESHLSKIDKMILPFLYPEYLINSTKNKKRALGELKGLNNLDKDFVLDLIGDVDITLHSWSTCARINNLKMEYPFLKQSYIERVSRIPWAIRLKQKKFYLKKIAQEQGISRNIINRKKASFGPTSKKWGKLLLPLLPLCESFFIKDQLEKFVRKEKNRYIFWNILNYSIWRKIYMEGCSIDNMREKIKNLLNHEYEKYKKVD